MFIVKIVGNKIVDYLNTSSLDGYDGYVEVPESLPSDADLRFYTSDFTPRPVEELVEDGLIEIEEEESEEDIALRERDALLDKMDRIISNPLRWEEMDKFERDEVRKYRRSLLNFPESDEFPNLDYLPTTPEILLK